MLTYGLIGVGLLLLWQLIAVVGAATWQREMARERMRGTRFSEQEKAELESLRAYLHSGPFLLVWPGTALGWLIGKQLWGSAR